MTAAAPRPPRASRGPGSPVERAFRRGQHALQAHDVEAAVEHLRQAAEADPDYARVRCWLGMALADAGRLEQADAAFAEAERLRAERADLPERTRAVVPLMRGLAWLDAGRLDVAREHLSRARDLAPHNDLVRAGLTLCDWDAEVSRDPRALLAGLELMPARHQARVLVRLSRHVRAAGRSHDLGADLDAGGLAGWSARREHRRSARVLGQAERAAEHGQLRVSLERLRDVQPMDAQQRRRQHDLFADVARRRVAEWRASLDASRPRGRERAELLFRMARLLREAGDDAEAAQLAGQWLNVYDELGAPDELREDALDALSCVAAGALLADDPAGADAALTRAFALRTPAPGELHRVRAHLALVRGEDLAARFDFETWLADFPLTVEYAWLAAAP